MIASREAELLADYASLIRKWNLSINLVSPSTVSDLEERHIKDSVQLAEYASETGTWVDLGSGGGFPAIPLAIMRPALSLTMIESDARKSAFLRTCARELALKNVSVITGRIESSPPQAADHVSARALAPLSKLLDYARRHLKPTGTAWFMKGRNWSEEVDLARREWQFDVVPHPSRTDPDAAILEITRIEHV